MSDLIKRDDALDILCKSCGISEDVEKCRKTSADGWCKEYCGLKNMPSVEAIPIEWVCDYIRERKDIPLKNRECVSEMFDAWVSYMAEKEDQEG